jgi:hypothetical protein
MEVNVSNIEKEGGKAIMTAVAIVAGAFVANILIGLAASYVPVVGAFAPEMMLALGLFVAITQKGMVQELGFGATVAGVFAVTNKYLPSIGNLAIGQLTTGQKITPTSG